MKESGYTGARLTFLSQSHYSAMKLVIHVNFLIVVLCLYMEFEEIKGHIFSIPLEFNNESKLFSGLFSFGAIFQCFDSRLGVLELQLS